MKNLLDQMKTSLPKYKIIQPSTGKTLVYRPFTVREEKNLIISNQTGSYEDFLVTLADIIDKCFSLKNSARKLPVFDIEYFFIKLRCKSVGELLEPTIVCPITGEKIKIELNLDQIEPKANAEHTKKIKLSNNLLVNMEYPTLENLIKRESKTLDYFDLLIECIQSIETDSELIEAKNQTSENLKEFIDLLTTEQYKKLISFFKTSPKLEKEVSYKTSDGTERTLILKGLRDFFQ